MTGTHHVPELLVALNEFIALGYAVAAVLLVYASYQGFRHLTGGARMPGKSRVVAITVAVLWVGAACFLVGCGWHHIQHASHLRAMGCAEGLCSTVAYAAALLQSAGEILAVGAASFLIRLLDDTPPPSTTA